MVAGKGKGNKDNGGPIRVEEQPDGPRNLQAGDEEAETPEYEIEKVVGARMGHLKEVWPAVFPPAIRTIPSSCCFPGPNGLLRQVGGVRRLRQQLG
jgi:hypothetical protein